MFEKCSLFWSTFYQSAVGQIIIDFSGQSIAVNKTFCEYTGYSDEELLNKTIFFLCTEEDLEYEKSFFLKLQQGEIETFHLEKKYLHKNGTYKWGILSVSLIESKVDSKKYFFAQVQDITDEKLAREYLQKAEKVSVAAQLAAAVAHEIRNPLTSIKGFAQLQKKSNTYNENYNTIMLNEVQKIETIISEYLSMCNPLGDSPFKDENIIELIEQVITLLQPQANLSNQNIFFVKNKEQYLVECNAIAIKQTLINIIKNALEAIHDGDTVLIKINEFENKQIAIKIIDSGCGISRDRLSHIGEPFYSTKERGTGLGLMSSFNIIEKHHGSIHIESEVNNGTTVTINLPIKQPTMLTLAVNN